MRKFMHAKFSFEEIYDLGIENSSLCVDFKKCKQASVIKCRQKSYLQTTVNNCKCFQNFLEVYFVLT
jgi:hypothetical protein